MNHASDTTAAGNGGTFDPRQAAALLEQTTQQARRKFEPSPPWLLATRAVLVLAALGAIWLSVRGQHPYRGPTTADIPVLIGFIVVNFAATVAVRRHAIAGVSGRSRFSQGEIAVLVSAFAATVAVRRRATAGVHGRSRFSQGEIMLLVVAFVATVIAMLGLSVAGVSFAWYPTTVLVIPGLVWAAISAVRANWRELATGLAIVVIAIVGAFAGPAGSWAVAAAGLCVVLLANAAAIAWQHHA